MPQPVHRGGVDPVDPGLHRVAERRVGPGVVLVPPGGGPGAPADGPGAEPDPGQQHVSPASRWATTWSSWFSFIAGRGKALMDVTVYPARTQIRGTAEVKVPTALFSTITHEPYPVIAASGHSRSLLAESVGFLLAGSGIGRLW